MLSGARRVGSGVEEVAVERGCARRERAEGGRDSIEFNLLQGRRCRRGGVVDHVVGTEQAKVEILFFLVSILR